jgi:hypothetical protein
LDRYLARTGYGSQQSDAPPERADNLFEPADGADGHDFGAHGVFDGQAHRHSAALVISHHARAALIATLGSVGALSLARARIGATTDHRHRQSGATDRLRQRWPFGEASQ